MSIGARQLISFDEYIRMEAMSPIRHEWLDGTVWAMAGGPPDHAAISVNVTTLLATQLRGRPCRVFSSGLRIRIRATGLSTYPDASVICGKVQLDPADLSKSTARNPKVLVEVLSASTEKYDRKEKLANYKKIVSLDEVMLIGSSKQTVDVWRREKQGWRLASYDKGTVELSSISCELSFTEIYRNPLA